MCRVVLTTQIAEPLKYKVIKQSIEGLVGPLMKDGQGMSIWQENVWGGCKGSKGVRQVNVRARVFQAEEQQVPHSVL